MMKVSEIELKIAQLKIEHKGVTNERKKSRSEEEEAILFLKHKAILKKITDLEWKLKSSKEKNDYRRSVLSMGRKWNSMKGAENTEEKKSLSLVVTLCDTVLELLDSNEVDDDLLKKKLLDLMAYIDEKRII